MNAVNVRLVGFPGGVTEATLPELPVSLALRYVETTALPLGFVPSPGSPYCHLRTIPIRKWRDGDRTWFQADWKDAR